MNPRDMVNNMRSKFKAGHSDKLILLIIAAILLFVVVIIIALLVYGAEKKKTENDKNANENLKNALKLYLIFFEKNQN